MAEHREQVDKRMMQRINRRVLIAAADRPWGALSGQAVPWQLRRRSKNRALGISAISATATNGTAQPSSTPALPTRTAKRRKVRRTSASKNAIPRGR